MNENVNLVELLKECPEGTKLYSPLFGEVSLYKISQTSNYPISIKTLNDDIAEFNEYGIYYTNYSHAECLLFPSKDQRDWGKWKYPKPKFDPKTLEPFSKVLARDTDNGEWSAMLFSHINNRGWIKASGYTWKQIIPYNEETKYLVSTTKEAPEFYRFWED